MVQIHEIDVAVGDVLHFGGATITVIDIENGEVTFRIDNGDSLEDDLMNGSPDEMSISLPR